MQKYKVLKEYFGYDSFRAGQEALIDGILQGRDVLGIMPTGAGKSICYQVPGLLLSGITLVISPLISLMMDQVKALNQAGVHAAYINSSLTSSQVARALQNAAKGQYKIIYAAPERLETDSFLTFVRQVEISMVTVDEAHCISQWGQDFRPSYLKIVQFIRGLEKRPVVSAFTATATQAVKEDIIDILELRDPVMMTTGFDRSNLYFGVKQAKNKDAELLDYVSRRRGDSGIIYCSTRKNVENVCNFLEDMGIDATRYHAGMSADERRRSQEDFIYDSKPVMVATNAFGMGIDKSNVRYVIHYNMPQSLENYYQEAGRAGRDGEPSECILYYSGQDVVMNQFLIENNQDNRELDDMTKAIVQERDRDRLKKMTFYCFTNECLRDYILRYFGEYGNNYCGNCSSCLTQFETVDVTAAARSILGCVRSSRQRYGTNVIVDTVHGANTAKIRSYRMNENPHYGELAGMPVYKLRQIMNYLQLKEYLIVTNDEYAVVKLTANSRLILEEVEPVVMKMAKEQEYATRAQSGRKAGRGPAAGASGVELTESERVLFEALRSLRSEIAREEQVPPYIVFSDKTLTHMSLLKPRTREDMLGVSGVGAFKYEKYGRRFLETIEKLAAGPGNDRMEAQEAGVAEGQASGGIRARGTKAEFSMTPELAGRIAYSQRVSLSDFIGQINELRDDTRMKRLTIKSVEQQLMAEGYLEEQFLNGMPRKRLLAKGEDFGIEVEKRTSDKGNEYEVLYYTEKAQREIVRRLLEEK